MTIAQPTVRIGTRFMPATGGVSRLVTSRILRQQVKRKHGPVAPKSKKAAWLTTAVLPAIFLVLGAGLTLTATLVTNDHQDSFAASQTMQQERTAAYQTFETAANAYAVDTSSFVSQLEVCGKSCSISASAFDAARASFQAALNGVYTYGSDAAVTASSEVASALPPSLWSTSTRELTFSQPSFANAYGSFLRVACRELPAQPRGDC